MYGAKPLSGANPPDTATQHAKQFRKTSKLQKNIFHLGVDTKRRFTSFSNLILKQLINNVVLDRQVVQNKSKVSIKLLFGHSAEVMSPKLCVL